MEESGAVLSHVHSVQPAPISSPQEEEAPEITALANCATSSIYIRILLFSLRLPFNFFGGRIYVHWSVVPLAIWLFFIVNRKPYTETYIFVSFVVIVLILLSIFLHELGHVLVYYYMYHISPKIVGLHFLGGVTMPKRILVDKKASMAFVAAAGPACNFLLGALFAPAYVYIRNTPYADILYYGCVFNIALGVLNMLPIFPMDGGQVVRSLALLCCQEKISVYSTCIVSGALIIAGLVWTIYMKDPISTITLILFFLFTVAEIIRVTKQKQVVTVTEIPVGNEQILESVEVTPPLPEAEKNMEKVTLLHET